MIVIRSSPGHVWFSKKNLVKVSFPEMSWTIPRQARGNPQETHATGQRYTRNFVEWLNPWQEAITYSYSGDHDNDNKQEW